MNQKFTLAYLKYDRRVQDRFGREGEETQQSEEPTLWKLVGMRQSELSITHTQDLGSAVAQ